MRLRLTIDHQPKQHLPLNYNYHISSWIYSMLHRTDAAFATWLHEQAYSLAGKRYKHFCFSSFKPRRYTLDTIAKIFEATEAPTTLVLSFNIDEALQHILTAVFDNNLIKLSFRQHCNFEGEIRQVEVLPSPDFTEKMYFSAKMPICISVNRQKSKHAQYLSPLDEGYAIAFAQNLCNKANALNIESRYRPEEVAFNLVGKRLKSKLLTIKNVAVKGYEYDFELKAPAELIKIGYYSGWGTLNSALGMGFSEEKKIYPSPIS